MNILLVEDDSTSLLILERALQRAGHDVVTARNGAQALEYLKKEEPEAIVTDWMMPEVDGIELIHQVRQDATRSPVVILISAIGSPTAKDYALTSGADDFLPKPCRTEDLLTAIETCRARRDQQIPSLKVTSHSSVKPPPYPGVAIASSTGGPDALCDFVKLLPADLHAAVYIVQHGPAWMLESLADRLGKLAQCPVRLGGHNAKSAAGVLYVAPGDSHMTIEPKSLTMRLASSRPINFVRPAADPLFESVALAFGRWSTGIVFTGMGRDACLGAQHIHRQGGQVLVQDPDTCVVGNMPKSVIEVNAHDAADTVAGIAKRLVLRVNELTGADVETR